MWFLKNKISNDQLESRLFEFKGAIQTCDLNVIKYSLRVLTIEFLDDAKESPFFVSIPKKQTV